MFGNLVVNLEKAAEALRNTEKSSAGGKLTLIMD